MSRNRSTTRRLRVEFLEGRDVPAILTGTDVVAIDPSDLAAHTGSEDPPLDPGAGGLEAGNLDGIMTIAGAVDGNPQSPPVDLAALVTVNKANPSLGDLVTVQVTVANKSDVQATGVKASVTLPAGLTVVSADAPADKFDPATGTWTAGTVAGAGNRVLTIKARVTDRAAMTVAAAVTQADQADDQPDNNAASKDVAPVLGKLKLGQSLSANSVGVGSTVVMTLAVRNPGPGKIRDVSVTDVLGDGLAFAKAMPGQGTYNRATRTWNVGVVQPGTTAVLRLVVTVQKLGRIESSATVTGTGFDAETAKLEAAAAITGVKPGGPATWAYFAGPNFGISAPIAAAPAKKAVALPDGHVITAQLLAAQGFALRR